MADDTNSPSTLHPTIAELIGTSGDLAGLTAAQRAAYYDAVCHSLGLNPLTQPFAYLTLNGKLRLYALRDCADQLRKLHGISIYITSRERLSDIYIVTTRAKDRQGREDESTGAVTVGHLKGDALANALMKCETKAKRRVTLSICGLGMLDESELDTLPQAIMGDPSGTISPQPSPESTATSMSLTHPTMEQMNELYDLAKAASSLEAFGHDMRRLLGLPGEVRLTKKLLRERLTCAQYQQAWEAYTAMLKAYVERDVPDHPRLLVAADQVSQVA